MKINIDSLHLVSISEKKKKRKKKLTTMLEYNIGHLRDTTHYYWNFFAVNKSMIQKHSMPVKEKSC